MTPCSHAYHGLLRIAKPCAIKAVLALLLALACITWMTSCSGRSASSDPSSSGAVQASENLSAQPSEESPVSFSIEAIAPYAGNPSIEVNGNRPYFEDSALNLDPLEVYSELDALGRCGTAVALLGPESMPTVNRGSIGMIKPSGWQIAKYDWIDGEYLFNRCHLIAYSLAGENDNPLDLITGTRSMNVQGMLRFEERIASYINDTGNHVLYRVTPVFEGDNLVASGVLMEAQSIEDSGAGVCFCAWCYNVEPGVVINYATGDSRAGDPLVESYASSEGEGVAATGTSESPSALAKSSAQEPAASQEPSVSVEGASDQPAAVQTYVLNTNTRRFHLPDCSSVSEMKEKNKQVVEATRDDLIGEGYRPCGKCSP